MAWVRGAVGSVALPLPFAGFLGAGVGMAAEVGGGGFVGGGLVEVLVEGLVVLRRERSVELRRASSAELRIATNARDGCLGAGRGAGARIGT